MKNLIFRLYCGSFGKFHPNYSTAHNYKLRYALHETNLSGAYMTDVIKDFEEKASGRTS